MARRCDVCGKGPLSGNLISHAHNVDGTVVRKKVCTKCLKAGKVKKA